MDYSKLARDMTTLIDEHSHGVALIAIDEAMRRGVPEADARELGATVERRLKEPHGGEFFSARVGEEYMEHHHRAPLSEWRAE